MLFFVVPIPTVTLSPDPPGLMRRVGSLQVIDCTVSTVNGVESSSVMISWMGPGGDSIMNDSRVIINPTTYSGNNMYSSSLQLEYLLEEDVGNYTCNVMILETSGSQSIELGPLICELKYITLEDN